MTAPARIPDPGPDGTPGTGDPQVTRPAVVPDRTPGELVATAVAQWRTALAARAGASALSDVERLGDAQLDLSSAHPSGLAQLFAGRPTRLSNLVREGTALAAARRRARSVAALADEHAQRYGLASAFVAIGVATWTETTAAPDGAASTADAAGPGDDGAAADDRAEGAAADGGPTARTVRAPVLLRPVLLAPRGRGESDYDLVLEPSLEVNPLLATALRARGALLDAGALARGAFTAAGFEPGPAIDRLRSLGAALLDGFTLEDRLLVGTFVHPEQGLVDDLDAQVAALADHEVVRALAGHEPARRALAHPLPPRLVGDRPLDQERGVGDLDPAQTYVLDVLAAGHHVVVDAPPGSDRAGTVAAIVADAAAAGRTVLHVAGHRRAGQALLGRLTDLGLDGLALDITPDSAWRTEVGRRLLAAMTVEPVPVPEDQVAVVQRELLNRRSRLQGYIAALHAQREPWGISAYDALQALARLTSARPAPRTTVRLPVAVAEALRPELRAQAAADLVRAAALAAFSPSAAASPWYGADLPTADRATASLRCVDRLLDDVLPHVTEQAARVAEQTGLVPATTPATWGEQLRMLAGVRGALDVFQPIVFERSAADLVAATADKAWRAERGIDMPTGVRRRLRKQAKDMVRPGRPVADLHAALVDVQAQRDLWQAHCPAGGWPRLPEGLAEYEADARELTEALTELSAVLASTPAGGDLAELAFPALTRRLGDLRQDRVTLETLPERTALVRSLDRRGLGELLQDLAERQVPAGMVTAELELAWWSTAFEAILRADPALAGYDGTALARLVAEFRTLDRRYVRDRALLALAAAREDLRRRLRASDDQTQGLFGDLVDGRFVGLRQAVDRYPGVVRHLRPCLLAAPMLVPHLLPPGRTEDVVVVDAADDLPLEAVVPALARGRQVVVVGDTRAASGTALAALAAVLPTVPLTGDSSRRDPRLTRFLVEHGYADRLRVVPPTRLEGLLGLHLVDGSGMPGPSGAVEGTQAEVSAVVELVLEHALVRPEESLAVVTPSPVHAGRVRDAVLAEVRANPALEQFFRPDLAEPFVVTEVGAGQGLSRDAVILSVGFGRTPHGRVLHRFGVLSEPGGDGRLLATLGAARRRLDVVSCFAADDLDADRLRAPGAQLLRDLLGVAGTTAPAVGAPGRPEASGQPDRLVLDLAERLWRRGLTVTLDHGTGDGVRLPLVVGHPDLPGEMLVAVVTDDAAYVGEPSVRVRDRQVLERLERLGWSVVQVWSAAAFLDPEGEADAIAAAAVDACALRLRQRAARRTALRPSALRRTGTATSPAAPGAASDPGAAPQASPGTPAWTPTTAASVPSAPSPEADGAASGHPAQVSSTPGAGADGPGTPVRRVAYEADTLELGPALAGAVTTPRGPRPPVERGLPISAYTDDQLDDLVAWLRADGSERSAADLAVALRAELGITRHGARVDAVVDAAVRRAR